MNNPPAEKKVIQRKTNQNRNVIVVLVILIAISISSLYKLNQVIGTEFTGLANTQNAHLTEQIAYLLTEQVEQIIKQSNPEVDLAKYTKFKRNNYRVRLNRLVKNAPKIETAHLVSPDHQIILSSDTNKEDKPFNSATENPGVYISQKRGIAKWQQLSNSELIEVYWPLFVDEVYKGYIITQMKLPKPPNLQNFLSMIRKVIIGVLSGSIIIILILIFIILVRPKKQDHQPEQTAPSQETTEPEDDPTDLDSGNSMFAKLKDLYDGTEELDQSFQASEEKAQSLMRVLNQAVLVLDMNMHIISHNEYLLDVLQIRTRSVAQKNVFELIQKNTRLLEMYRRAKDPLTVEVKQAFPINLLNGKKISMEVLARPFQHEDSIFGVIFYIKNIEKLKEVEKSMQRSMKYGVISQLSSSIGHEIRNPLSSMAFHTEIVGTMINKTITDEKKLKKVNKSLNILETEGERLRKLIEQFFNLAKSKEIVLDSCRINDLMGEVYDLVNQQAIESNIELEKEFDEDLPMVLISKDQLKQVIINLVLNGYDAIKTDGTVIMKTYFHENNVVIGIQDSGGGIPEEIRESIFDMYFTTKATGGGIGLAISRKIVEAHLGKLYFKTTTNQGTTFFIELPTSHK